MPVKLAEDQERAESGVIYVAPPNRHLLVAPGGTLKLTDSEPVHFVRPSADLLLESMAGVYGAQAVVCVLTGSGRDAATGVEAVHFRGGTVIVQDPESAEFKGMPSAAVATGVADFVLGLAEIPAAIRGLVEGKAE